MEIYLQLVLHQTPKGASDLQLCYHVVFAGFIMTPHW